MIVFKYGGIFRVGEIFFNNPIISPDVDLLRCRQMSSPDGLVAFQTQSTILINLKKTKEELNDDIESSARYEIRRAEQKDGTKCQLFSSLNATESILSELVIEYDRFAKTKKIRPINLTRLQLLKAKKMLFISRAIDSSGVVLSWHVYLISSGRVRLLYSLSSYRNLENASDRAKVGRANRLLHWYDILSFKSIGYEFYDFGGYYVGDTDLAKLRINSFKAQFGGERRIEYNGFRILNIKGKLITQLFIINEKLNFWIHHFYG